MKALIVDHGMSRAALAGARGLAAAGWTVGIATAREKPLSGASRAVAECHWAPPATPDEDAFLAGIAQIVSEHDYDVVFGADDAEIMALVHGRDAIRAVVPYPDSESLERALDKLELTRAAQAAGIATPATSETADGIELPLVVKGRVHAGGGASRQDASVERSAEEVEERAAEIRDSGGKPIFQEVVSGVLMAVVCLVGADAEILGVLQQQAELTVPATAGVTVRGRTVAIDDGLLRRVRKLLADLRWRGLAELQFIQPPQGEPRLIDLNGRFYGSMALGMAAGVNLPAAWAELALEGKAAPLPPAREGVRYQWLEGDLRRAVYDRRGGLVRDLLSCFRFAPGAAHSIWQLRDPKPGLRMLAVLTRRAAGRAR